MDSLVLTGPVSNEGVRRRTFMGFFVLTPVGSNERAIEAAGLDLVRSEIDLMRLPMSVVGCKPVANGTGTS